MTARKASADVLLVLKKKTNPFPELARMEKQAVSASSALRRQGKKLQLQVNTATK